MSCETLLFEETLLLSNSSEFPEIAESPIVTGFTPSGESVYKFSFYYPRCEIMWNMKEEVSKVDGGMIFTLTPAEGGFTVRLENLVRIGDRPSEAEKEIILQIYSDCCSGGGSGGSGGSGNPARYVEVTLPAASWDANGTQTVSVSGLKADENGYIALSPAATSAETEAAANAKLRVTGQAKGKLTVTADGTVPIIDLPACVTILDVAEDGGGSGGSDGIAPLLSFSGNTAELADQSELFHIKHTSETSGSYDLAYAELGTVNTADLEDGTFIYFDQPGTYVFGMAEAEYGPPGYTFNGNGYIRESFGGNFLISDGIVMLCYNFDPEEEGEDVAIGHLKTLLRNANQNISFKIYRTSDLGTE